MMENQWNVQIWGVRGAAPAPAKEFMDYGGNTVCVSVECGTELIVFDAGSGLAALGEALKKDGQRKRMDIFLSHLHLDHVMGFFTFHPFYDPEMEIHIYGQMQDGYEGGFKTRLGQLLGPPYWPLGFKDFRANIFFHPLLPGSALRLAGQEDLPEGKGLMLHTLPGNHPNGSLLYRIDGDGKRLVYGLDCEMNETIAPAYLDFSREADLLIWDANFTAEDMQKGWGHSTWEQGVDIRRWAKAERILMIHYSLGYTDSFLSRQETLARQTDPDCCFAKEGMMITL